MARRYVDAAGPGNGARRSPGVVFAGRDDDLALGRLIGEDEGNDVP